MSEDMIGGIAERVQSHDLLVVTTAGSESRFRSSLERVPEQLAETTDSSIVVIRYP